jgi:uncharacterized protein (DUF169 family)
MESNHELYNKIHVALNPPRQPVGVRFLFTESQYAGCGAKAMTTASSYCNMVRMAGLGKSFKATLANSACSGGSQATGLEQAGLFKKTGSAYSKERLWLYNSRSAARKVVSEMLFMDCPVYGLELRPLNDFSRDDPDVVIFIVPPYAAMRLVQGYTYNFATKTSFRVCGNQAICSELTSIPFLTNDINCSFLCSGTRHRCNWGDDEMGIGIAYGKLAALVDGLMTTLPEAEPQKKKQGIAKRAQEKNIELDVKPGREYFTRKMSQDW